MASDYSGDGPSQQQSSQLRTGFSTSSSFSVQPRISSAATDILDRFHSATHVPMPSLVRLRSQLLTAKDDVSEDGKVRLSAEAAENLHTALSGFALLREQSRQAHSDVMVRRSSKRPW